MIICDAILLILLILLGEFICNIDENYENTIYTINLLYTTHLAIKLVIDIL